VSRRVRHPCAAVLAGAAGASCLVTPWLYQPPLAVRVLAALLASATWWVVARGAGAGATAVRDLLLGRQRSAGRARLASCTAALLLVAAGGAPAGPAPVSDVHSPVVDPAPVDTAPVDPGGAPTGPVHVQVGLADAPTDEARAHRAVEELVAAGGATRSVVLVAVPTGSGWVDRGAVQALEAATGGDVATVTVQYAQRPSWVEYLLGADRAARSAQAVLGAVAAQLATLPGPTRPRLLVFGESLGATAAATAVADVDGVGGCLLAGRPDSVGTSVPGCADARNDDDPVPWWGPGLLSGPRAGLPWLPVVTFWQVTGAMVTSLDQPAGHGHRYGASLADDWRLLLGGTDRGQPPAGPQGQVVACRSNSSPVWMPTTQNCRPEGSFICQKPPMSAIRTAPSASRRATSAGTSSVSMSTCHRGAVPVPVRCASRWKPSAKEPSEDHASSTVSCSTG
jgi:hypothetical protein